MIDKDDKLHLLVLNEHLLLQLGQELACPLPLPGLGDHVQQAKQLLHLDY